LEVDDFVGWCLGGSAVIGDVGGRAGTKEVVVGIGSITSLSEGGIDHTIALGGQLAIGSASVCEGVAVLCALVALLSIIDNTITAEGHDAAAEGEALWTACIGEHRVVRSIVANFVTISSSVSALPSSGGRASISVRGVAIIALLSIIENAVSETGEGAVQSAR